MDVFEEEDGVNWFIPFRLFWKKAAHGTAVGAPVLSKDVQSVLGKDGITALMVFAVVGEDMRLGLADIFLTQATDFINVRTYGM